MKEFIRINTISKGVSNQVLLGEKSLKVEDYLTGGNGGDNESGFAGLDNDNYRSTYVSPLPDKVGQDNQNAFGSAHPSGCPILFGDGSVRMVAFSVNVAVFKPLGNINAEALANLP